jgi:tRNA A37 threonylcarbamoyladenosine dehydratase
MDELPAVAADADLARRFGGVARLYGAAAFERFRRARIAVIGIGGVGSWAAEALARSAVGTLVLIDLDHVAESNTNRQIHALGDEYGKAKVAAMAERVRAINPAARALAIEEFVNPDNVAALVRDVDAVVDCIDQVSAKAALIAHCHALRIDVVTCGAAGGRTDPTRIRAGDLARAAGDPLLAKVRYRLRRRYGFPRAAAGRVRAFGVAAVYSDEPVRLPIGACAGERGIAAGLSCAGYGSSVAVTAPLGFAAAALALQFIAQAGQGARGAPDADPAHP